MKKALTLLLALATACSMGVTALAADDTPGIMTPKPATPANPTAPITGAPSVQTPVTPTAPMPNDSTGQSTQMAPYAAQTPATPTTPQPDAGSGTAPARIAGLENDTTAQQAIPNQQAMPKTPVTGNDGAMVPRAATPDADAPLMENAQPFTSRIIQGADGKFTVGSHELFLVDSAGKIVGTDNKLIPDSDYTFKIYYNDTAAAITDTDAAVIAGTQELTGALLADGTVRIRTVKGSSNVQSAKIKTTGRGATAKYSFAITTRPYFGVKMNDVEYALSVSGGTGTFVESSHLFRVGYEGLDDGETNVGEGGIITIYNDRPVILKEQFTDIAKSANYKSVTFEGEDAGWSFTGRVSGMADSNFYFTYDVIPEMIERLPEQEFKFLTFRAGVNFPSTGEMRIDVADVASDFSKMYAYLYRSGKLTKVSGTYDVSTDEIVFRTNYLGTFIITDKVITDAALLGEDTEETVDPEVDPENPPTTGNPGTGTASAMGVFGAVALASLASSKFVARRKKK